MRLVDIDGEIVVPVVDESHCGATYEMKMTVWEFFEKCCAGFAPEVVGAIPVKAVEAIPVEWLEEFDKYYGGGVCDVRTILTAWRKSQEGDDMKTYEKIETIYARDIEGTKKLIEGQFRSETVEYLKDCPWEWTEKVDGTNIRVYWDGHSVSFGGRTERAQIPAPLVNRLNELFGGEANAQMFEQTFGEKEVILFGEGYGAKIQNGGAYIPDGVDFILFDVWIAGPLSQTEGVGHGPTASGSNQRFETWHRGNYQAREWVEQTARTFGVKAVPIVGRGTLAEAVEYVKGHPKSMMGTCEMEGVVCRPAVELRDRRGERVIVKIKWNDFKHLVEG